ncbi:MAG: methionine--tRNA ligase subunit beta [Candidatus Pacearchaeota archaeon]|nr:methionine--tRNA ligase subunit beta [Candidatus Pacearchaeota archaeon]
MKPEISYEDFEKLDLRVAEIIDAEEIAGADKLWKLKIDAGELGERTICAGIKQYYPKEDLVGKKIILLANLAPRKLKGIESRGMLLAASTENHEEVVLLSPESDIENGSRVS